MVDSLNKWKEDLKDIKTFISKYNNDFLLNELVYTRLVSALEVFLVESVRDIFVRKPSVFVKLNKTITLHLGEILSYDSLSNVFSKILNSETHNLSRIGFEDVLKFYLKLNIDLRSCSPGKEKMLKYHEMRHLIIHRLGKVDNKFKKAYNFHKEKVFISDTFLKEAFADFDLFVDEATKKFEAELKSEEDRTKIKRRRRVVVEVWFDRKSKNNILKPDYFIFKRDDSVHFLKDILEEKKHEEGSVILTLRSKPEIVSAYLECLLKEAVENADFKYEIKEKSTQSKGSLNISKEQFKKIESLVVDKKLSTALMRDVSKSSGISMTQVRFAFRKITYKRMKQASS